VDRPSPDERRRLIKAYKSVVDAITRLLYRADPVGIGISIGSPEDEYSMEAAAIASAIPDAKDAAHLQRLVHAVFVQYFGEQTAGPESAYAEISNEIWAASLPLRTA
jgi:hypothetical protein